MEGRAVDSVATKQGTIIDTDDGDMAVESILVVYKINIFICTMTSLLYVLAKAVPKLHSPMGRTQDLRSNTQIRIRFPGPRSMHHSEVQ